MSSKIQFAIEHVDDVLEVSELYLQGAGSRDVHTVVLNRPIRIHLRMVTPGESFSNYNIKIGATHYDQSEIMMATNMEPVSIKALRPPEINDSGRSVTIPLYFNVLFSQTQKKPIMAQFRLEKDGEAVSDYVASPCFKVVSKPPVSVKPASKRRKVEADSYEAVNESNEGDENAAGTSSQFTYITQQLSLIKSMLDRSNVTTAESAEPKGVKRKYDQSLSEHEMARNLAEMSHESRVMVLREMMTNHPQEFDDLLIAGTAFQRQNDNPFSLRTTQDISFSMFD